MPHMLAQEHMSFVDAIRYGAARTEVTMAAAISAIGSTPTILVLTLTGNGVWTLGSSLTVPPNILLWIPSGVTVQRASGVTLTVTQIVSWSPGWETGPGTTNRLYNASVYTEFTRLLAPQGVNSNRDGVNYVGGVGPGDPAFTGRQVILFSNEGAGRSGLRMLTSNQDDAHIWDISINALGYLTFRRPAHVHDFLVLNDAGFGVGDGFTPNVPVARLHSILDNTLKATSLWGVPSDSRLKTVLGDFTDGLAMICALPQAKRFQWNGKGSTINDGAVHYGRIAQETLPIAPSLVRTYEAKLNPEDAEPTELYAANDSPIIEMLINAVKELAARVEALETPGPGLMAARQAEPAEEPDDATPRPARRKRSNG